MKLQISFDITDLDQAITIAQQIAPFADIIEVGSLLILNHGTHAVKTFRNALPNSVILADTKIVDRGKDATTLFAKAGANWVTVMGGTNKNIIHAACTNAHALNAKVMLDLIDVESVGQIAMEAKNLGVDALLFHEPYEEETLTFLDRWEMVHGNTDLPIFISNNIKRDNIHKIIAIKPDGVVIGKSITDATDPVAEAQFFKALC
ncbi:MAG TPA: orotidine 5'-phosphate decarboxylase [Candidatus Dependentiae bacterium]|nr:orotidine 5'-phosphate decarboxylase [Candidatus Dependentiae bacterium]HRQ62355.1 orotidine 5'-phosphate decarboxylase [Candidatus Dependentiae bacterium]